MGQNFEPISYATTKSSRSLEEADAVLNIPPATLAAAFLEGAAFFKLSGTQSETKVKIDVMFQWSTSRRTSPD